MIVARWSVQQTPHLLLRSLALIAFAVFFFSQRDSASSKTFSGTAEKTYRHPRSGKKKINLTQQKDSNLNSSASDYVFENPNPEPKMLFFPDLEVNFF